jgi:DNA-binding GntR family transcriptional regulator
MGTSRIPVRDALRRLAAEGLVEPDERGSYRVILFDIRDVEEIYAMRQRLEGLATGLAATSLEPGDIADLTDLAAAMKEAVAHADYGRCVDLNFDFHSLIYNTTSRRRLVRTISGLWSGVAPLTPLGVRGQMEASLREHDEILKCLGEGDSVAAEEAMVRHIGNAGKRLINAMKEGVGRGRPDPLRVAR